MTILIQLKEHANEKKGNPPKKRSNYYLQSKFVISDLNDINDVNDINDINDNNNEYNKNFKTDNYYKEKEENKLKIYKNLYI